MDKTPDRSVVVVSGASGLVGRNLVAAWTRAGYRVCRLVRKQASGPDEIAWNPSAGLIELEKLRGAFALVHLAGESLSSGRWTPERKRLILSSRVEGTALLAKTLASMPDGPRVLISASAIGYYGDRGDELLTEDSSSGIGFLARVCEGWEDATEEARRAGIRVVRMRLGLVLTQEGGALPKMIAPMRLGLGGAIGTGRQYMSVIGMSDVVGAFAHVLAREDLAGPINVVSPHPVRNRDFVRGLGRVLGRPTVFSVPGVAVRMVMGEMGPALLLASSRVIPSRLEQSGYRFVQGELEGILREALGR